ncbi:hypothetical protein M436DRAFT_74483 [Aureobasidium namibiae CBS 147.97]|uniref:Cyanovirin-N domain-containing protein n=1 Tax=Aureobasidium namibiae CBS 147.97 TaxID=1043004 RepID=A0A074WIG6_9PEZI|nr:uncharacterized protein M436DRAFT_74483 [Aureobasidium namibiae CBS 147.97]KEQ71419.1 hypothetical protein M436DRAFT_74483 [Aureobasidium namibiae CBS 147.97]
MYTKAIFPTIFLAGQALRALALPATTVTIHSVITRTTIVPVITEAAGSNPSNVATPALFTPGGNNTSPTTLSSFSDASPSSATQLTITVTKIEARPFPVFITVTSYYCPTPTSEVVPSSSIDFPRITFVAPSSTSTPAPSTSNCSQKSLKMGNGQLYVSSCVLQGKGQLYVSSCTLQGNGQLYESSCTLQGKGQLYESSCSLQGKGQLYESSCTLQGNGQLYISSCTLSRN